ncbi:MAG TPA: DUF92 domain-containing protein [Terriglobales bacterium]|nr:DUF92 domain-containing protein [Terriglobales bacterium]
MLTTAIFVIQRVWLLDRPLPTERLPAAFVITILFGIFGYLSRGVNKSGAVAGTLVAFLLYFAAGPPAFLTLLGVFILTWITTRIGYLRKAGMGLAENRRGRNAKQVLANVGAAAAFAILGIIAPVLRIAAAASLVEAAADTASSECGQAVGRRAYLITSGHRVDIGTDGGISVPGTVAGLVAAFMIAALAASVAWIGKSDVTVIAIAGFLGTVFDSLLGATVQRRGLISNNGVNFASTVVAALLAILFHRA